LIAHDGAPCFRAEDAVDFAALDAGSQRARLFVALEDWLNDGVKGFISVRHDIVQGNLPQFQNLRLTMPTPEYLLAMKCLASRINPGEAEEGDVRDIVFLIRHLKLKTADEVMKIVAEYYPPDRVPVKAQYLVEGLFAEGKI